MVGIGSRASGPRRLLVGGSLLYIAGWTLRAVWRASHPAFDARGQELVIHAPMWIGAAVVVIAAGWALAARLPERGYPIVLGAGATNLAAELWHAWAHYHHHEYGPAHSLMAATTGLGVVSVALFLLRSRQQP